MLAKAVSEQLYHKVTELWRDSNNLHTVKLLHSPLGIEN